MKLDIYFINKNLSYNISFNIFQIYWLFIRLINLENTKAKITLIKTKIIFLEKIANYNKNYQPIILTKITFLK